MSKKDWLASANPKTIHNATLTIIKSIIHAINLSTHLAIVDQNNIAEQDAVNIGIQEQDLTQDIIQDTIVRAAMLLSLATIIVVAGVTTTPLTALGSRSGGEEALEEEKK